MNKIKLIALAVLLALVGAACSSNASDEAEAPTAVPTGPTPIVEPYGSMTAEPEVVVDPTAEPTEAPTPEPTEEPADNTAIDCDEENPAQTLDIIVATIIHCLRQAPSALQTETLNLLLNDSEGIFDRGLYNRLQSTYGTEAVLIITSSSIASIVFDLNASFEETPEEDTDSGQFAHCDDLEDAFQQEDDEDALFQPFLLGTEEILEILVDCIRDASDNDLQLAAEEMSDLFGEDNAKRLIELYGIEATIIVSAALGLTMFGAFVNAFSGGFSEQ